ncbi:ABC transporter permease [Aquiluna sp.]|nr:ABC transporter permease [Aquiluna sp.]MDA8992859.1 ABC transporter permease [Aquiluna sp.]
MGALIGAIAVYMFFATFGGAKFIGEFGTASWLNVFAELAIVALPVSLIMIAGDLDLSVGSVIAGSSMTMAIISGYYEMPTWIGLVAALIFGILVGLFNGLVITKTGLPSFIVTLASLFVVAGLTLGMTRLLTGTANIALESDPLIKSMFGDFIDGKFAVGIFWTLAIALVIGWIQLSTKYGNWIYAIGGDVVSARAQGIPVAKVKVGLFMASGFGAAFVGVLQTVTYNGAGVSKGQSFVFNSIIAVVIGGVLMTGGYGSVFGVLLGAFTFAVVNQGIYYTGWEADWASLIIGVLVLAAVLTNNTFRRLALSAGSKKAKK